MGENIHHGLMSVNCDLIATIIEPPHNQPMIDPPQPEAFTTFGEWLKAVCARERGMQRRVAEATFKSPQAVTKWLNNGNIETKQLRLLADFVNVDYGKLRMLLDGENTRVPAHAPKLLTRTEMGAIVGKKWEELVEPARSQILNLIETLCTLQRDSYRLYVERQSDLAKQRKQKIDKSKI